jgi:hypothetical protein
MMVTFGGGNVFVGITEVAGEAQAANSAALKMMMGRLIFKDVFHYPLFKDAFGFIQQMDCRFFAQDRLTTAWANQRRDIIYSQAKFPPLEEDGGMSVNQFSLPANDANHKVITTKGHDTCTALRLVQCR